jgi:hypothetical protein
MSFPDAENHKSNKLYDLPRIIQHVAQVEVVQPTRQDQVNVELRKKFLRNEIDEKQFKKQSLANHKANQRKGELCQVAEMVRDALSEICLRMQSFIREQITAEQGSARMPKPEDQWSQTTLDNTRRQMSRYYMEVIALRTYANECVENINTVYGSTSKRRFNGRFMMDTPPTSKSK